MTRKRRWMILAGRRSLGAISLSLLASVGAGGCGDGTPAGTTPGPAPAAPPTEQSQAELVSAALEVDGANLGLVMRNLTAVPGSVSLSALLKTPGGLFLTENAGTMRLGAGQSTRRVLSAPEVKGLDLGRLDWTDATVSYEVRLDDGRQAGMPVALFVDGGQAASPRDVVPSGVGHGFPAPEFEELGTATAPFTACFANAVTLSGVFEGNLDFHRGTSQSIYAEGMPIQAIGPDRVSRTVYLDGQGCTTLLPRIVGTWTFTEFLTLLDWPVVGVQIDAIKLNGGQPFQTVSAAVTATNNFTGSARLQISMNSGEDAQLQAAFTTMQHTLLRATSLGAVIKPTFLHIQMNTSGRATYDHTLHTLNVTSTSALNRRVISHETGHWIHENWMHPGCSASALSKCVDGNDYTYCKAGDSGCTVPPNDGCFRSTGIADHSFLHIEWESAAHIEGIASFFTALAFNDINGTDCYLPDIDPAAGPFSCETVGLTMKNGPLGKGQCYEWTRPIFGGVGVEHDWTKLYWDYVSDERANFVTLLTAEKNATAAWTRTNHVEQILAGLSGKPEDGAFRRSAVGNIWDGAAH